MITAKGKYLIFRMKYHIKFFQQPKEIMKYMANANFLRCNYNNNWWIVPNIIDVETTTTGSVTITGGKVNINNTPLQLSTQ